MSDLKPSEYVERLYQNIKMNWNQAAEAERERIIKLLERDLDVLPEFSRAIELIKGEQK